MNLDQYVQSIAQRFKLGNSTEHTFRGDLQLLIESLVPDIRATNEPKRQSCGAPDYILTKKDIPVGYIEAKDIGDSDLEGKKKTGNKSQFDRYKPSLNNIIFTDYLDFLIYRDSVLVARIAIAEVTPGGIKPLVENFDSFKRLIKDFCTYKGQTIKSSKRLAELMANKARLLANIICDALTNDVENNEDSTLKDQMIAFKQILIHDIAPRSFADVYAQTIAYGMFAARLNDPTLETFSRQEASELIPKSNPFLRKLFGYIAGPDIDDRIRWIVDDLTEIFIACNVENLLKNYGKSTKMEDPIIHFYETFLSEYDPKLRKARGVWYTPAPVVNFIVRAVDDILKTEFDLPKGLADNSKTKIQVGVQTTDKRFSDNQRKESIEVHKVQILDPATGTGTFLAEVIKLIYKKFEGQQGIWSNYVDTHLLPRLNGFELLMASYAMAHLKLEMFLKETGFKPTKDQRFRVYLTNSLEEHHPDTGTLWAGWLSAEANEANRIKRDTPVMCVIGNPPYSVSSGNKSDWIENLTKCYKSNLNERNIQPLSDDYIKFIRFGQFFIEKKGSGILAYISNNSFIDGTIHRQMRKQLLDCFDKVYILNLHGNSKKRETCPDGSVDQNVFDIMQGVSINIFIKTGQKKKNQLGEVFHHDLYGYRESKYEFLNDNNIQNIPWVKIKAAEPNYLFVPQDNNKLVEYNRGLSVERLFVKNATGVKTERDEFTIKFTENDINDIISDLRSLSIDEIRKKHALEKDGRDWQLSFAKKDIIDHKHVLTRIQYRPFDYRYTAYTGYTKGFMAYPRAKIMSHLVNDNLAFISTRMNRGLSLNYNYISRNILDLHLLDSAGDSLQVFPLYLYDEQNDVAISEMSSNRMPNLNMQIVENISQRIKLTFTTEKVTTEGTFAPIDILDYIYAVLYNTSYRYKYKDFLNIDYPCVPYPKDQQTFWQLVNLGNEIRQIHLFECSKVEQYITKYPVDGDNVVNKISYIGEKVWINDTQYFECVPEVAWNFFIGGYQPAQKWLKDRKGRTLDFEDIMHYQKIIVALVETDRIMKEIDKIAIE